MQPMSAEGSSPSESARRDVLILGSGNLRSLLTLDVVVPVVAAAYVASSRSEAVSYPIVRETLPHGMGVFGIKSGFWPGRAALGLKAADYWPANRADGLDNHQATVLLIDPLTGTPEPSWMGTSSPTFGRQPRERFGARLDEPDRARALAFAKRVRTYGIDCQAGDSLEKAVHDADIVVTATPSSEPLVPRAWLQPGTHVNAMGADDRGKQEHDLATLRDARVVVDDWRQASELRECQHGLTAGIFRDAVPATIGAVITGDAAGRRHLGELTLFDATAQPVVVPQPLARNNTNCPEMSQTGRSGTTELFLH